MGTCALEHWNWKWNQPHSKYSTYNQELLAGIFVLSSQTCLLGTNGIVLLCDQEPKKTFQKGPPPEKAILKQLLTYLTQFRSTFDHIQGMKNKVADYTSLNKFDALLGDGSKGLAKEAVQHMDVQLDLSIISDTTSQSTNVYLTP